MVSNYSIDEANTAQWTGSNKNKSYMTFSVIAVSITLINIHNCYTQKDHLSFESH